MCSKPDLTRTAGLLWEWQVGISTVCVCLSVHLFSAGSNYAELGNTADRGCAFQNPIAMGCPWLHTHVHGQSPGWVSSAATCRVTSPASSPSCALCQRPAVPCHRALAGPSGGPSVPRLGVGTGEHGKARTMSATTAYRARGEVEAERRLWFPLKLKGPIIFQEAGGVNEPLQSGGALGAC